MKRLFKYMGMFWKAVHVILLLLCGQAYCDLSLPGYTSDIVNVGIQQGGIEESVQKAISKEKAALIEQVKQIAHVQDRDDEAREITLYNSMVFGIHNYYRYATMIATDCEQIHRAVSTVMKNRLYGRLTKKGQINEVYIRKNYGDSKQIRFMSSIPVAPVGYIQTKTPLFMKKKVCKYTPEGRAEIHKNLGINTSIMLALMRIKEPRRSVEYMDNRISLYAAQYGRCAVTGKELGLDEIHSHHKQPLSMGGTDKYMNLVIVHRDIHRLIASRTATPSWRIRSATARATTSGWAT